VSPHVADLSVEGAFVETPSELPLRTIVILRILVGGHDLKLEGEIVHCEPPRGFGLRFMRLMPYVHAALEQVVNEAPGPSWGHPATRPPPLPSLCECDHARCPLRHEQVLGHLFTRWDGRREGLADWPPLAENARLVQPTPGRAGHAVR
jgi:hypothetical protein